VHCEQTRFLSFKRSVENKLNRKPVRKSHLNISFRHRFALHGHLKRVVETRLIIFNLNSFFGWLVRLRNATLIGLYFVNTMLRVFISFIIKT
jgi:hypothetical protein